MALSKSGAARSGTFRVKGKSTYTRARTGGQWVKTERASKQPPNHPVQAPGFSVNKVTSLLDGQGHVRAQYIGTAPSEAERWQKFWTMAENATLRYRGIAAATPAPKKVDDRTLTVYPLGDPHIGLLSWGRETGADFDTRIAERELFAVVDRLVDRAPASALATLANLGDFFHAETDKQLTPSGGNKLDVDTRWLKVAEIGFSLMRRLVDRLLSKHRRVIVINVPGNHDPHLSRMLALYLRAIYESESRVQVVDNANPYIYQRFGRVLLGYTHKPRKAESLGAIMATDRRKDWGETEYHHWLCGHIHTLTRKEEPGCVIETFETLAANDYWHHDSGYRSRKSLCAITYSKRAGEISRVTVDLNHARREIYGRSLSKPTLGRIPKVGG